MELVAINSIAELYDFFGSGKPAHPLITVIRQWPRVERDLSQIKFISELYYIAMKSNIEGSFPYGRSSYDYREGTMVFIGPGQTATFNRAPEDREDKGWAILFHPDLIRKSELGKRIREYSFFHYDQNEALHLSDKERDFLHTQVDKIEQEVHQNLDRHSHDLIVHNLETILKYSRRYYDRQFYTRSDLNKDLVARFDNYLRAYYESDELERNGIPTVKQCGEALNLSPNYLSDLLKIETGMSARDHIHRFLIESAKTSLLNPELSIKEVAFGLGFDYPQHFSKLFKAKTGLSPSEYRSLN